MIKLCKLCEAMSVQYSWRKSFDGGGWLASDDGIRFANLTLRTPTAPGLSVQKEAPLQAKGTGG